MKTLRFFNPISINFFATLLPEMGPRRSTAVEWFLYDNGFRHERVKSN